MKIEEERSIEEDGRRVRKRVTLSRGGESRSWTELVRLYPRSEVVRMAATAGLRLRDADRPGTTLSKVASSKRGPHGGRGVTIVLCFVKAAA